MLTLWKTTSPVLCSSSCDEGHNHAVESEEPEKHSDNTAEADMHAAAEGKKSGLRLWPDVILHGDKLFSYDNRRAVFEPS